MLKKIFFGTVLLLLSLAFVAGCGSDGPGANTVYKDGTYTAVSANATDKGYVEVTLTLSNDEVTDASIVEYNDIGEPKDYATYGAAHFTGDVLKEAHDTLADAIVANDTWDVDIVTGASGTSEKVRSAAKVALERALTAPSAAGDHFDGTFMAISDKTDNGWSIALVTIENEEIVEIILAGTTTQKDEDGEVIPGAFTLKTEEYPWGPYHEAKEYIVESVVNAQSTEDIDAYTGATGSSSQWLQAIQRALEAAQR